MDADEHKDTLPGAEGGSVNTSLDEPSQFEAIRYFYGLGRTPKLVARTGKEPFDLVYVGGWPRVKRLFNIGRHPIIQTYDQGPRMQIRDAIQKLEWWAVDIVRIGYNDKAAENPIVVLITVRPGSTTHEQGQEAVDACRKILRSYNLEDVAVEMKEGYISV